jgi:tRNA 2-thiouridine synthesizing protein A
MRVADVTRTLDASGLACPMPVVRTRQAIDELAPGEVLEVISTDRGSLRDLPAWAESTGNRLIEQREDGARFIFLIEKG